MKSNASLSSISSFTALPYIPHAGVSGGRAVYKGALGVRLRQPWAASCWPAQQTPCAHMREAVFFQTADSVLVLAERAFVQTVHKRLALPADSTASGSPAFRGRWSAVRQREAGYIAGQVLGLNAHFVFERVHQLYFLRRCSASCVQALLPAGPPRPRRPGGGFLDVLRHTGLGRDSSQPHRPVLAQTRRVAELVLVGHPQKSRSSRVLAFL